MSREHRRPLIAFVVVALLCALVVGNSITLASGSSRNLAAEVRAAVVGESPAGSPTDVSSADLIGDDPSRSPDASVLTPSETTSNSPTSQRTTETSPLSPSSGDEAGPRAPADTSKAGDDDDEASAGSTAGGSGSSPPPEAGPSSTPSTPNPEPSTSPTPSPEPSPTPPPTEEAPESEPVLTFDDITNPPPPVEPDPGPTGYDDPEAGDDPTGGGSLESTNPQGDAPVGRVSEGAPETPQEEAPTE